MLNYQIFFKFRIHYNDGMVIPSFNFSHFVDNFICVWKDLIKQFLNHLNYDGLKNLEILVL